jgi:hypothetical protein
MVAFAAEGLMMLVLTGCPQKSFSLTKVIQMNSDWPTSRVIGDSKFKVEEIFGRDTRQRYIIPGSYVAVLIANGHVSAHITPVWEMLLMN